MKTSHLLLALLFLGLVFQAKAQIRVEKRKHLKGYHIDIRKKANQPSSLKINDSARYSDQDGQEKDIKNEEKTVTTVVKPVAESAFITFSEPIQTVETGKPTHVNANSRSTTKGNKLVKKQVLKIISHSHEKVKQAKNKIIPDQPGKVTFEEVCAYIGLACGILAVLGFVTGVLLIFALPGIIFSLLGLNSPARRYAYIGLILSLVVAIIILTLIILLFALFA